MGLNSKIVISIIVPVYNSLDCLEKCVNSICNQTYRELEIILINDGSTDGTGVLCDRLQLTDERIRVFHKQNGGSSSARNMGIDNASGEYIGFVDSDDFIEPDMYEKLLEAALTYGVPIVQSSRDEIDLNSNRMEDVCAPPENGFLCKNEDFMKELLMHKGDCSFCTKLIRRSLLNDRRFPEGKLNEDFYLLIHILQEIKANNQENDMDGIYILPDQMYHVFYRIGSNTRKKSKDEFSRVFMDIVDNAEVVSDIVDNTYPNLKEVCIRFGLYQRLDYMLHIPVGQMTRDNVFYGKVRTYLRTHMGNIISNKYLSTKNRVYLLLLAIAPKVVRTVHKRLKNME